MRLKSYFCTNLEDMKLRKKAVFNWSGGKDSALALYKILEQGEYEVQALLTTVNGANGRSSMHGIPAALLRQQADSIGLPLYMAEIAVQSGMEGYERTMADAVSYFKRRGVTHFIFGDIYLEDVRKYREKQLAAYGITVVEPLWGYDTREVMSAFLSSGLKTLIVTVMADCLDRTFIGRTMDDRLIADLPDGVDICGENGEYHTFCYAGGMFRTPVPYRLGPPLFKSFSVKQENGTEQRFTYWVADLQPAVYREEESSNGMTIDWK